MLWCPRQAADIRRPMSSRAEFGRAVWLRCIHQRYCQVDVNLKRGKDLDWNTVFLVTEGQ